MENHRSPQATPHTRADRARKMDTITKRDLIVQISNETGMTQREVKSVVQTFIDAASGHLASGDEVVLRNFGTFQVSATKPKIGRNPRDPGIDLPIPARAVVRFRPGKELKEKVARLLPSLLQGGA